MIAEGDSPLFKTAAEVRQCAEELCASLADLKDAQGTDWTQENFRRLAQFAERKDPSLQSFYRKHGEKSEFLWDYMAASAESGIFLAAESEQDVATEEHVRVLKHDFSKLLYVYSPIRVLITKARDFDHADTLSEQLAAHAHDCCLSFNPGSVFVLHFGLWNNAGNISYLWQSAGEPNAIMQERLAFTRV